MKTLMYSNIKMTNMYVLDLTQYEARKSKLDICRMSAMCMPCVTFILSF